jgi:4'-phosphopantetheinyl transferase EntD
VFSDSQWYRFDRDQVLDADLVSLIRTPGDRIKVRAGAIKMDVNKLIFSLKEAVYKSLFPEVQKVFDFCDVNVFLDEGLDTSALN